METQQRLTLDLVVRDLGPEDLADLDWSGGPEHLNALASALGRQLADEVALVVIFAPNGRSIAVGAVDFSKHPGAGELWMLSVHPDWQSLGVGTILISALESKIIERGLTTARLGVEHDNPRAAALYRRLGYREIGTSLDDWPTGSGRLYVTVCFTMAKTLTAAADR